MKIISLLFLYSMVACQSGSKQSTKQTSSKEQLVGADKDKHGCIGSAGYSWSAVKGSCIRVFEDGTPFVKYDVATGIIDSTQQAYVVLSNDKKKTEVFFGGTDKPVVMDALPVMEGETMPVLFENATERIKLRSYRDSYQLLYMDSVRYLHYYNAEKGLGKWLK